VLLGDVFMVYQYGTQAHGVILSLAVNYQNFARMQTDYASADPIWAATERPPVQSAIAADWKRIDAEDIEFTYPRSRHERATLVGASLTLTRGQMIAIVGASGSGKSTFMRVLAGLYGADRARFTVDGVAHVRLRNLGALATLIPQDAEVFEASILDNITLGVPHPTEAVDEAIRVAGFDSVLAPLPQGLATMITERGLNLSGGQKQRLALARGILAARTSSLLLLDEPTSSLDPLTEARIFTALRHAMPDACIVASVHRFNLLPRFDRVVLMDEGRVLDSGTVDELRERQPLFNELWRRSTAATEAAARAA
jgi:ABC-type multidrug transport system fused ATPase/permease subunit